MDSFRLSKKIFSKLADISSTKIIQSSNTEKMICEYIEDKNARIKFFNGTTYEGPIIGGKLHGNGLLCYDDNTHFKGTFINNRIEGVGEIQFSELEGYKGDFLGFKRHGTGSYWHNGLKMKYEGNWKEDYIDGKGILKLINKWTYQGEFMRNKKHGQGEIIYMSGARYKGQFQNDVKHGEGTMFWRNPNEIYRGQWRDNKLEGFGVYIYQNNFSMNKLLKNHYRGFFKDGQRDGIGVHFYSDGSVYLGEWKQNHKHGQALFIDGFGEKFQMQFKFNQRIFNKIVDNSITSDKRLGFVLQLWEPLRKFKYKKNEIVNFILNSKSTFKELFKMGIREFVEETEESRKLTILGVLKLLKKMKIFNRKSSCSIMEWIVKQSEHNFIFIGYNKQNIKVQFI
jgi:hypothetical protein